MSQPTDLHEPPPSARALLRERDYIVYLITRALGVLGTVTQSVTMGWQVYDLARASRSVAESALYVGFLGLATFVPLFFLALPAGVIAHFEPVAPRRRSRARRGQEGCADHRRGPRVRGRRHPRSRASLLHVETEAKTLPMRWAYRASVCSGMCRY